MRSLREVLNEAVTRVLNQSPAGVALRAAGFEVVNPEGRIETFTFRRVRGDEEIVISRPAPTDLDDEVTVTIRSGSRFQMSIYPSIPRMLDALAERS